MALSVSGAAIEADSGGPFSGLTSSVADLSGARVSRRLTQMDQVPDAHGVTVGIDVALYGQWASETLNGTPSLATLTWQLDGHWQVLRSSRLGSGRLGWNFLGSEDIGNGSGAETLSGNVGSISGLNANVAPNAAAIDELYWRHESASRRWSLLAGRVDQSAHFDANRVANDGYGQFLAFAFENNLSIPWQTYGGFGGLLRLALGTDRYLLASVAAIDDEPRVVSSDAGQEGWNQMLELDGTHEVTGAGRGHVRLTSWHSRIPGADGFGIAVNLDQELGSWPRGHGPDGQRWSSGQLTGFFRAGIGEPAVTPVRTFVSGGAALASPFGRPHDRMALGVAWSDPSPWAGARAETLVEVYYRFALSSMLSLTPDLQVVIDPALDPAADSTIVLGVRLHLRL